MNMQGHWDVIYTCPNREKKVYNELQKLEIAALLQLASKIFMRKEIKYVSDKGSWLGEVLYRSI